MKELSKKYDMPVIIVSMILTLAFVGLTIAMPEDVLDGMIIGRDFVFEHFGSLLKLFTLIVLIVCIWLMVSKYGNVRFGKAKPKYKTWTWVIMVFCSSFSMSIMFWAVLEWAEYFVYSQPTGLTMDETAKYMFNWLYMHWGIPVWGLLIIGIIPMGYNYYVRKKGGLNVVSTCAGVLGDHPKPWVKFIVNFVFVYGTISALCISLGAGLPMLTHNLEPMFGIETTFTMTLVVALLVTIVFTWSAASGIDSGIRRFSLLCAFLTIPLLIYIFLVGNPQFAIDNTIQGLGFHIQNFIGNFLDVGAIGEATGFEQSWTVFYFAWWISVVPCYWIFTVKISKGRTVRSIVLTLFAAAVISTTFFFGILSNHGLWDYIGQGFTWDTLGENGTILDTFKVTGDDFGYVNDFLTSLPGGMVVLVIWFIASFFALTTMMDSAAFVMSEATSRGLKEGQDPSLALRVFWCVVAMLVPMVLLWAGADLTLVKCLLVISSIPVSVIIAMSMISIVRWLRQDFGLATAMEIREFFMTADERAAREEELARLAAGIPEEDTEGPSASRMLNPFRKSSKGDNDIKDGETEESKSDPGDE